MLRDCRVIDAGAIADRNSFLSRIFFVDFINADAILGNPLQSWQEAVDDGSCNRIITTQESVKVSMSGRAFAIRSTAPVREPFPTVVSQ